MRAREITPEFEVPNDTCGPALLALSQPHRCFVVCIVEYGNTQADAARRAGFSDTGGSAKATGHRLAHDPRIQDALIEASKELIRTEGAASIRTLVKLRDTATDERVRMRAASEILDRCGGLSSTSTHTIAVHHHHDRATLAELDALRVKLERELGITPALPNPNVVDAEFSEVDDDLADIL